MKKNSISKVKNPNYLSKKIALVLCLQLAFVWTSFAQRTTQLFEKEIAVPEEVLIKTKGPSAPKISGVGMLHIRPVDENYVVSGRKDEEYIYVIDMRFEIFTWDEKKVKQSTKVTLECETQSQTKDLLSALEVELRANAAGQVLVDCELNIDRFMIKNGWFRSDDNSIQLSNGKEYKIKYLELSTSLYVPRKSQLNLDTEVAFLSLGDHAGSLDLRMNQGTFTANKLNELKGQLKSATLEIKDLGKGDLTAKGSKISINRADELILETSLSTLDFQDIGKLIFNKSLSDKMSCGQTKLFFVEEALYTSFDLVNLKEVTELNLRNCDLTIANIHKEASKIRIKNQNATMKLGIQNLRSYLLVNSQADKATFQLPESLLKIEEVGKEKTYAFGAQPYQTRIDIDCSLCKVSLSGVPF